MGNDNAARGSAPARDEIHDAIDRIADAGDAIVGGLAKILGVKDAAPELASAPATNAPLIEAVSQSSRENPIREIRVTSAELVLLGEIARRGGEMSWNWDRARPDARNLMAGMINKRIVREQERVTHAAQVKGQLFILITDEGRQCLAQQEKARMVQRALPAG